MVSLNKKIPKNPKRTARLDFLKSLLIKNQPLWDIGCDHGLLGIQALNEESVSEVHFVDPSTHAIEKLKENLEKYLLDKFLTKFTIHNLVAQKLNGYCFTGNWVMAGFGWREMESILTELFLKEDLIKSNISQFVISPHSEISVAHEFLKINFANIKQYTINEKNRERIVFTFN